MRFKVPLPRRLVLSRRERLMIDATNIEVLRRKLAFIRRQQKEFDDAVDARVERQIEEARAMTAFMALREAQRRWWQFPWQSWWDRCLLQLAILYFLAAVVGVFMIWVLLYPPGPPAQACADDGAYGTHHARVNRGVPDLAQAPDIFCEQEMRRVARIAGLPRGELTFAHFLNGRAIDRGEFFLPPVSGARVRNVFLFKRAAPVQQVFTPTHHFHILQETA